MYKETLPAKDHGMKGVNGRTNQPAVHIDKQTLPKVDRICEGFLDVLRKRRSTNVQNIITAHLCKSRPDIEAGLTVVADLNENDPDFVEPAVEHICFLADVNAVYDAALGMYNLHLALLVAQQSQKVRLLIGF